MSSAWGNIKRNYLRSISEKRRINFFRQMGLLTGSGISFVRALQLQRKSAKGALKPMVSEVIARLEEGASITAAVALYHKFFDPFVRSMIKAGEESGMLPDILKRLSEILKARAAFKRKIIGALTMPILTLVFAVGVVFFLGLYVIPNFAGLLSGVGADLPPLTQFVLDISNYLAEKWKEILTNVFAAFAAVVVLHKTLKPVRYLFDRTLLRIPVVGEIILFSSLSQFAAMLGILLKSGVDVVEALNIAKKSIKSLPLLRVIDRSITVIMQGGNISTAYLSSRVIPPIFSELLESAEESGGMDKVLPELAVIYKEEADYKIGLLGASIQPIMTILIGGIVGVVAASLIMGMIAMWASQGGG
jgi:type IV pilus assembly protein PilC